MDEKIASARLGNLAAHAPSKREALWPRADVLIAAALLALPLLVLLPAALLRGLFFVHDLQFYFYPYHAMPAELLRRGELPLWNPYAFSGIPLLGDGQTALLYPPSWLFFTLPPAAALNYDVLLQFGIAGAGMYLLARDLRLDRQPALVGAITYMFCGFMTARVVHLSIQSGVALIPLVFLCARRALRAEVRSQETVQLTTSKPRAWFVAAAGAVGLQALAGHPQIPVYTALALGLYALVRAIARWRAANAARPGVALARRALHLARLVFAHELTLAGIYALGYALAAIQLVPWIELGAASPRAAGASFDFVFGGSTAGSDWLLMLFPYLYGSLRPGPYAAQPVGIATQVQIWEHSAYAGILPLALAAYALIGVFRRPIGSREDKETRRQGDNPRTTLPVCLSPCLHVSAAYFGVLLAGAALFAAGKYTPLASAIYALPVVGKLRDVERAMALGDFALAALAAIGMQRVIAARAARPDTDPHEERAILNHEDTKVRGRSEGTSYRLLPACLRGEKHRLWRPSLLALAATIVAVPLAVVLQARQANGQQAPALARQAIANLQLDRPNAIVPLALAALSALLLAWWSERPTTRFTRALALGLVLIDLGGYAALFNPLADARIYRQPPDVLAALRKDGEPFRKATFLPGNDLDNQSARETLAVSWGMAYGIEDINGFNSLQPRRYTDFLFGPGVGDVSYGMLRDERLLRPESPILSELNVRYLLVPANASPKLGPHFRQVYASPQVRVYENTLAYPRAFFAESVRGETNPSAVLRAVTADGFDGRKLALVETAEPPALALSAGPATATIARWSANRIEISTSASAARLLVLGEMYFPGWRATVDGAETPIYRTNYLFRGIVVPAGQHTVTFEYRPASVLLGAAISAMAVALSVALLLWRRS